MRMVLATLGAAALSCAALSGCSFSVGTGAVGVGTPTVAKSDLQNDITDRLQKAGEKPESVTCTDDLKGTVGTTTRCEVVLSATNAFEPIVTVTKVEGTTVSYEMTPALSKPQLEQSVAGLVTKAEGVQVESASCESGLRGTKGAKAYCNVDTGGVTLRRPVEVTKVDGLMMNIEVIPVLAKTEVETSLLDELEQQVGQRPDTAECKGDLEGKPDATIECTIVAGAETQDFLLTVTAVDGDSINYSYEPTE